MHGLPRLVDANLNRTLEGLRVTEDIARFILNDRKLAGSFKLIRHRISVLKKRLYARKGELIKARNVKKDIGRMTRFGESRRRTIGDIFQANMGRIKESLRVLEEAAKLMDTKIAEGFKKVRFRVYELEKISSKKIHNIHGNTK